MDAKARKELKDNRREANKAAWAEMRSADRAREKEVSAAVVEDAEGWKEGGVFAGGERAREKALERVKVKELKKQLMTADNGKKILAKVLAVAGDDSHSGQMVALKMCMDRMLPVSAFEEVKEGGGGITVIIESYGKDTPLPVVSDNGKVMRVS